MSAPPSNTGAQPQDSQELVNPPPAGAPPAGVPVGQPPNGPPGAYPPQGQPPYGYAAYPPPQAGAPGYNLPPVQYQYPGSYYPPPPGQYQAQYPNWYPPPPGQYPAPGGQPQYAPPPGPPLPGQYPPPGGSPYGAPSAPYSSSYPIPGHPAPPAVPMPGFVHQEILVFLGAAIPDPNAPPAPLGTQKVPGYDPTHDYNEIMGATANHSANESKRQSLSPSSLNVGPPAKRSLSISSRFSMSSSSSSSQTFHSATSDGGSLPSSPPTMMPTPHIASRTTLSNSRPSAMASTFHSLAFRAANLLMLDTQFGVIVMQVLLTLNVLQMDALNDHFTAKQGVTLSDRVASTTSGHFGLAAVALTLGPLQYDVNLARKALAGMGTDEMLLTEVILGRPSHEIRLLKGAYRQRFGKDLVEAVKSDLSGAAERMFVMALNAQKPASSPYDVVDQALVAADVESLHEASKKSNEVIFFEILINRSNPHIASVIAMYSLRYKSLGKVIKKTFKGTVKQGLIYIFHGVKPKRDQQGFWRDAKLLEKSMAGMGTHDEQLIYRLVRAHWNPQRMEAIKEAYKRRYSKTLEHRVTGETSGRYKDLLVALVKNNMQ